MEARYQDMEEITHEDYRRFLEKHPYVTIENIRVRLPKEHKNSYLISYILSIWWYKLTDYLSSTNLQII